MPRPKKPTLVEQTKEQFKKFHERLEKERAEIDIDSIWF